MHALFLSLALGQAAPASPAAPVAHTIDGRPLRPIALTRLPDGGFSASLDGQPVAGADFYRAVLRPDLAARSEQAQADKTALYLAAGLAPLAGLGIGWVAGTSQQWPLPPCVGAPPGPVTCTAHDQVAAQNQLAMTTALVAGGVSGLATGALLWFLGSGIHPPEPTADEAEALIRAYRARAVPRPDPGLPRDGAASGPSLELGAGHRSARLALRLRF
jgi:hypothetical protein